MNAVKRLGNLKPSQRAELSDWLVTALAPLTKLERECIVNGPYGNPRALATALRMPYGRTLSPFDPDGKMTQSEWADYEFLSVYTPWADEVKSALGGALISLIDWQDDPTLAKLVRHGGVVAGDATRAVHPPVRESYDLASRGGD